ncbi:unnamed protein product, partial [Clonostachys rhizophaga]
MVAAELCPPIVHADTPPPCDGEALSGPGASQDTAIVIPEDSDAEDEGYGGEDSHSPQSYTTTATSIAIHFSKFLCFGTFPGASPDSQHVDSMGTKQLNRAGCRNHYGNYATESQVGVEGDAVRVYGSHLDLILSQMCKLFAIRTPRLLAMSTLAAPLPTRKASHVRLC